MNTFYKLTIALLISIFCIRMVSVQDYMPAYSQMGSSGTEVEEIQRVLKERGLFTGEITGYYGAQTAEAVRDFQRQQGRSEITVDGAQ